MGFGKFLLKTIVGVAKDYIENSTKNVQPAQQERAEERPATQTAVVNPTRSAQEWEAYFKEILMSEFPAYGLRQNVPVTDMAGFANDEFKLYKTRPTQAYKAEWGQPYTFVLESGGQAKGVVMLGDGHSHDSGVKYLIARMYAKKMGLPYINFYTQMPNERSYVVERIRKMMA